MTLNYSKESLVYNSDEIYQILTDLGYSLRQDGKFYRAKPIYRDSGNPMSLRINKTTGKFIDFSAGYTGSFEDLIALTTNEKDPEKIKEFLKTKNFSFAEKVEKPKVKVMAERIFPEEMLLRLLPQFDFFLKKGISRETLKTFEAGCAHGGKLLRRIVFNIRNKNNQIIGFSGRTILNPIPEGVPKWKHISSKSNFLYPLHLNREIIKEKREVILVESIGDILALWESGIKNVLCLFGVSLSSKLTNEIVVLNPNKIILATNNEVNNNSIGNDAAIKIKNKLNKLFDEQNIIIKLPVKKDFGDMLEQDGAQSIIDWYNS